MKIKILCILLTIVLSGCGNFIGGGYFSGNLKSDIANHFLEGQVDVKVMKFGAPPENRKRYDEILDKIADQYKAHKDEFKKKFPYYDFGDRINKLRNCDTNYFISWDPILGVSESEIQELYQLQDFYETGAGTVNIEHIKKDLITINSVNNIKNLNTIGIDLSNKTVSTDYGIYKYISFRKNYKEPPKTASDKWNLHEWVIDAGKTEKNSHGYKAFYIGQLVKTKEVIIFLRNSGEDKAEYENIILSFKQKEK